MNPLLPPTPTLLPPAGAAPIIINMAKWRLWNFTDETIMVWQQMTPARTQVLQIAALLAVIIIGAGAFIYWIQGLAE